jgi:hypothetical protein
MKGKKIIITGLNIHSLYTAFPPPKHLAHFRGKTKKKKHARNASSPNRHNFISYIPPPRHSALQSHKPPHQHATHNTTQIGENQWRVSPAVEIGRGVMSSTLFFFSWRNTRPNFRMTRGGVFCFLRLIIFVIGSRRRNSALLVFFGWEYGDCARLGGGRVSGDVGRFFFGGGGAFGGFRAFPVVCVSRRG